MNFTRFALTGVAQVLAEDPGLQRAVEAARSGEPSVDLSAPAGARAPVIATLAGIGGVLLAVTATGRAADDLTAELRAYLPEHEVAVFPAWETLPHERLSPRNDTVARRLAVLRRLAHPDPDEPAAGPLRVLVAPVRALLAPVVTGLGELEPVSLRPGQIVDLDQVVQALVDAAYTRTDMVERRGEFAVRGGLIDIFPPTVDHPLRVELFGDEVDEVRAFAVADQRSLNVVPEGVWAPPCREILLTDAVRARAQALMARLPGAVDMLDKLAAGIAVEGMESLAPVLADGMQPLTDLLPPRSRVLVVDPERVRARAKDLLATTEEFLAAAWSNAAAGNATPVDLSEASFHTLAQARADATAAQVGWWQVTPFEIDTELATDLEAAPDTVGEVRAGGQGTHAAWESATDDLGVLRLNLAARPVHGYAGDVDRVVDDLRALLRAGWRVVVTSAGAGPAKRLAEMLGEADVPARVVEAVDEPPVPSVALITTASASSGFVAEGLRLAHLTETDLIGKAGVAAGTKDMRRMPSKRRSQVDPLTLKPGDHVVHSQHGVGRFVEMISRSVGSGRDKATREYLVIEYAPSKRGQPGDRLYVPSDSLDQVSRYVGGGEAPTLNKMGGSDWAKTKARARRHVRQIAGELIRLYSARMATSGHAFGPDTPWQRELEDAFAYIETPDQLATIDEVKADMEKPVPMDRLICGDVGYGKTEIAVRAAFKAVQDGKQVAVLVPTTLLVSQHYETFSERFAAFPVTVKALSRFQNQTQAGAVLDGLKDGTVDVVIGTHRLLSGSVAFKDLGLVVVDEEQRFGVEHKETLKQLRTNVDVLAMSATPIPRTLEMAITGIREMSTLATPPEERHPVLTYVGGYDEKQIAAAIRRELLREGQVFYIHNKVDTIASTVARLAELVPQARIGGAHGKMGEHRLEQVIDDFWEKRLDVLVCTTIVETGLDISNANTLIVERSDVFGLSQLHQLRGRVGRGRERAYAYFLYPTERPLTDTAQDRLATIAANTDLGAGMAVAMKDLEIRGAGNLLGGEQSGHIAGVGFDLYVRMVGEAVADLRGGTDSEPEPEMKIELPVDAHLPHDYVSHERLRLEAYRKLAAAVTQEQIDDVVSELNDRYGEPPEPVANLVAVARFRVKARAHGVAEVTAQGRFIRFAPMEPPESAVLRLRRLYPGSLVKPAIRTVLVPQPTTARVGGRPLRDTELLSWCSDLLDAVTAPVAIAAGGTR
ncbi:MAG: transcription-repair coupling factor [Actinomycetales bacterium]